MAARSTSAQLRSIAGTSFVAELEDRLDKRPSYNTISRPLPIKPMRKLFATLLFTSLALPLHAQRNLAPSTEGVPPRPINVAREKVEKPEKPKEESGESRSLLKRMFGSRPTPTPAPAPTPAPVAKRNPRAKSAPADMPTEAAAKVTPKIRPAGTAPAVPPTTATVKPKTGKGAPKKGAPAPGDAAPLDDGTKFKNAKARALEDAHIKDLKGKADSEVNETEAHKALVNYNRALFQKIREIDPSVSDYAGKVEQSMTRRIGAEKGNE
jgi:hypothetical protein